MIHLCFLLPVLLGWAWLDGQTKDCDDTVHGFVLPSDCAATCGQGGEVGEWLKTRRGGGGGGGEEGTVAQDKEGGGGGGEVAQDLVVPNF